MSTTPGGTAGLSRRRLLQAGAMVSAASVLGACEDSPPAATGGYAPTIDSLARHRAPDWFRDAKLGVFIHWGPYSIPAYAPHRSSVPADMKAGGVNHFKYNAYAEWYQNSMLFEDGPTAAFHRDNYGESFPYSRFGEQFNEMLEQWDPEDWARTIAASGARYLVLVTKHHDGFTLWPSAVQNPHARNWSTRRDVVGELAEAARGQGLRFGVYYSGGIDWSFRHRRIESFAGLMLTMPGWGSGYLDYANAHYRELIERYRPDYLWNDISYPSESAALGIIAEYYNRVEDGLVNDRWIALRSLLRPRAWRRPEGITGLLPPEPPAWDVRTPEYTVSDRLLPFDWETTRGIGHSFGFNREEGDDDLLAPEEIIRMVTQVASRNGNVLLNTGPRGDGQLDPLQVTRLKAVGDWLADNADSVQDTRPVPLPQNDLGGIALGATRSGNQGYIHLVGTPQPGSYTIELGDSSPVSRARLRGAPSANLGVEGSSLYFTVDAWPERATQVIELDYEG